MTVERRFSLIALAALATFFGLRYVAQVSAERFKPEPPSPQPPPHRIAKYRPPVKPLLGLQPLSLDELRDLASEPVEMPPDPEELAAYLAEMKKENADPGEGSLRFDAEGGWISEGRKG